eukprot:CAMPEP_0181306834 /NCGR_PEP_ID=MMETSP1101-20121128/10530_1 /TAXON_ID=46948 /ORGANISM="Rhodomonas abbreviata, Strain Caron Lab Isolate" /LENGTH=105 /DNA_ID=CAMNT_0023412955 /DNA_START=661 /DNA_END=974 /DNA_ORIENTATION=+
MISIPLAMTFGVLTSAREVRSSIPSTQMLRGQDKVELVMERWQHELSTVTSGYGWPKSQEHLGISRKRNTFFQVRSGPRIRVPAAWGVYEARLKTNPEPAAAKVV